MSVYRPRNPIDRQLNRDSIIAAAATIAAMAFIAWMAVSTIARGEELEPYRFNLYAAERGAGAAAMRFKVQTMARGPLGTCYALGAIAIDALSQQYPDKDFMGGCADGELLTLRELVARANALLPREPRQ